MRRGVILGLGVSGLASARYLSSQGLAVIGIDRKPPNCISFPCVSETTDFQFERGDVLIKSPGIPPSHPMVLQAQQQQVEITSEIGLALDSLKDKGHTFIGITGSNGKTTTTSLITHILNAVGRRAHAVGNIGTPLIDFAQSAKSIFVCELSSFQLEMPLRPLFDMGVILNITPNHADRYDRFEDYVAAKWNLKRSIKKEGVLWVQKEAPRSKMHEDRSLSLPSIESLASIFLPCYRSKWDKENCVAAWEVCRGLGVTQLEFQNGCSSFAKPPHRLQYVGQYGGVHYINDSKATSVAAVKMALESVSSPLYLIAGGVDKGGEFAEWEEFMRGKAKKVMAIGQAAKRIQKELSPFVGVEIHPSLKSAFVRAKKIAERGETILLSPGCSSYDQFNNYIERGETFIKFCQESDL